MVVAELENQNRELQTRNTELESLVSQASDKAEISQFSISGMKKYNYTNIVFYSTVQITVRNLGINDLKDLNLTIVAFGCKSCAKTVQIDYLAAGKEKQVTTNVEWSYGSYGTSTATLKLENITLNESYVLFSQVY